MEPLGLDPHAESVYRAMLAHPGEDVARLAGRLRRPEDEIRDSLGRLAALAMVQPSELSGSGFQAVGPETAMELLLARQHAELAAQRLKVEASRAAAAQLIADFSALRPRALDPEAEHLIGLIAIRERIAILGKGAEMEVMTLAPGGAQPADALAASRGPTMDLFERGVRTRAVYMDSARRHQPTLDHLTWLESQGERVRTAPTLPIRMIIFDRRVAVLPADTGDDHSGAVVVRGEGTVAALCALFENIWESATPLDAVSPSAPRGMPRQEAEVLRLLTQGLTDETIAKRLGVSPRTARRIAADLMQRLDARSRFEAGVHAVQDGWLPPTR